MTITARKQAMREEALARRVALRAQAPDAAERMARNFLAAIPLPDRAVVSAFVAIGEETDPAPLIGLLQGQGPSDRPPAGGEEGREARVPPL